jgi:S-adenosylmethionine:tRNA ribosyltransferase-isomerase
MIAPRRPKHPFQEPSSQLAEHGKTGLPSTRIFFDYHLPAELIAQEPCAQRDRSRLLLVRRNDGILGHRSFADLPELLDPRDLLILNDTRVVPARLVGRRSKTGGKWEGLFLRELPGGEWELMAQTRGRLLPGEMIEIDPGHLSIQLIRKTGEGHWLVRPEQAGPTLQLLEAHGRTPLPPYIRKGIASPEDAERYQTVFARQPGAIAAPTAGLHFTHKIFSDLRAREIAWAFVTLHVGQGTFQPIQLDDYRRHQMHREWGELSEATAREILNCRQRGGRVVAVGTTSVRVLESVAAAGPIRPWLGETDLFIYPPYSFKAVDALVTNFHLPKSSLLLLVNAFAGVELTERAYMTAIAEKYRFYSYGDAMLIL